MYYFGAFMSEDPAPVHNESAGELQDGTGNLLVFMPRNHAKSRWATIITPIWLHLVRGNPFQLIVSFTDDQAAQLMRDLQDPRDRKFDFRRQWR